MKQYIFLLLGLILFAVGCGGASSTHTPEEVVAAFQAAGLEAEAAHPLTKEDYGVAPYVGQGVRFFIPSLCADCGGRIIASDNPSDLESLKTYYDSLGESSALFFSWTFTNGNILVQINGDLDESAARQYESALNQLFQ